MSVPAIDEYSDLIEALGPHAPRFVQSRWLEASQSFTREGIRRYLQGAKELSASGLGWSTVLLYLRELPGLARSVGEQNAFNSIDCILQVYSRTDGATAEKVLNSLNVAQRRLVDPELFDAYLDLVSELAHSAPGGVAPIVARIDHFLGQLTLDGLRRWALMGVQAHINDIDVQRRYFELESEEGRSFLRSEADGTMFADVERRLSLFLRALWGRNIRLRSLVHARGQSAGRRSTIDGMLVRLPQSFRGVAGPAGLMLYRAAAAHAAAHIAFTTTRFPVGELKPLQVALVSLIEDARVECLSMRLFPGLRRLWLPFHVARAGGAVTAMSLFTRLSRALIDEAYEDDDPWVSKARRMFFDQRDYWEDQSISRTMGSLLGNDLGQMRVQFNFRTYVVEPAYRDDNMGVWDFGDTASPGDDEDIAYQGAKLSDGEEGAEREQREQQEQQPPPDGEEEKVRLTSPLKHKEVPEEPLSPPVRYDEWDYLIGRERPAWTTLLERSAAEGDSHNIDEVLERHHDLVNRLKYLVRASQVHRPKRLRKRIEGDRLDLDACINASIDMRTGIPPDPRVHTIVGREQRDLSVLVLLDLSQSTNDVVPNAGTTVLELAREATALLADAMERIGDSFAIHGFCSNGRHDVGYYRFKDFDRPYGVLAKSRLAGMTGQLSTRMGSALRHASRYLDTRRAHKKLVLLITDGEPSDIDVYDPQYLVFDARKAVEENHRRGIYTYCMSLDPNAEDYVSRIFGVRNWTVVDHVRRLPEKLPLLYMRLTH